MTQFAADSFTGLTSGQTLQSQSVNFLKHPAAASEFNSTSTGTVYNTSTTTSICRHITSPPSADYSVSCDLVWNSSISTQFTGVAIRMDPTVNTMYFGRYSASAGWQLYKSIAGTVTQLGKSVAESFSSGTKNLKVVAQGATISLYNEGDATPVITVTDTSITAAGYAGIRAGGGSALQTSGIHITNFSADTLDAGETSLSAISIVSGTPVIGSPAITQNHVTTASEIVAGIPTLGTPSLTDVPSGTMVAENIAAAAPVLGTPALVSVAPVGSIIWPSESDVRLGVAYGPTGTEYTGTMAGGGGTYPTAESIAAAVLAAMQANPPPTNTVMVNHVPLQGDGTPANPMRPA